MNIKVTKSGFVAGGLHKEGEILEVTERQANTAIRRGRAEIIPEGQRSGDMGRDALKAHLDSLGVPYHGNASVKNLQKLVDEAEADPTA